MRVNAWWKTWGDLTKRLFLLAASFASLVGLLAPFLLSQQDLPWWTIVILIIATSFFLLLVVMEFLDRAGRRVYVRDDRDGIRKYMHRWIEHGGRVAIWTRNMTWAENPETRNLLRTKAANRDLIVCLPEANDFARELAAAGAELCEYGAQHLESPASRFTIVFFGRNGSRVAVGREEGGTHVIEEFDPTGHPAFYLAEDLVTLVRAQSASREGR